MRWVSKDLAGFSIATCIVGAAIPFYFTQAWHVRDLTPSGMLADLAIMGTCFAFPVVTPCLLLALMARAWRHDLKASKIILTASVIVVAVGNLVWRTYSHDPKDFDFVRLLFIVPPTQLIIYGIASAMIELTARKKKPAVARGSFPSPK